MWCRDITECLVTEGDRLEAMKEAEQMCVTVRQNKLLLFLIPMIGLHFHRFRRRRCDLWSSTLQHNFCLNATETWRKALKRGDGHHFIFLTHKIQKFWDALLIFFYFQLPPRIWTSLLHWFVESFQNWPGTFCVLWSLLMCMQGI